MDNITYDTEVSIEFDLQLKNQKISVNIYHVMNYSGKITEKHH